LFPVLLITGVHTIVFGHSRYHLPLMPILALYAAALSVSMSWRVRPLPRPMLAGAAASVFVLSLIWVRQVAFVDASRIASLLHHAGL
jgi:hypothetical protein